MSSRAGIVESIIKPLIEDHFKTNSNNLVGVEIGVDKGHMSNETIKVLDPSLFYMIDPWDTVVSRKNGFRDSNQMGSHYNIAINQPYIKDNSKVKILKMRSVDALQHIPDNSLHWIFVDGDHTYTGVKADLEKFIPKMVTNGIIIGDDLTWDKNYGDESGKNIIGSDFLGCPIFKALVEFSKEYKNTIESLEISNRLFSEGKFLNWDKKGVKTSSLLFKPDDLEEKFTYKTNPKLDNDTFIIKLNKK